MYIPKAFEWENETEIQAFIKAHPFATFVTALEEEPMATHLPFIIEGSRLVTHLSLSNPQSRHKDKHKGLVIFQMPHAYISPTLYEFSPNVPTWNYLAVHVYGEIEWVTQPNEKLKILHNLMHTYEENYRIWWEKLPENYIENLLNGMIGMVLNVTSIESKAKASQNKSKNDRENIINFLEKTDDEAAQQMGLFMEQHL